MALGKVSSLGFGSQVLTQDVIDKLKAADEAGQIKPVTAKITAKRSDGSKNTNRHFSLLGFNPSRRQLVSKKNH